MAHEPHVQIEPNDSQILKGLLKTFTLAIPNFIEQKEIFRKRILFLRTCYVQGSLLFIYLKNRELAHIIVVKKTIERGHMGILLTGISHVGRGTFITSLLTTQVGEENTTAPLRTQSGLILGTTELQIRLISFRPFEKIVLFYMIYDEIANMVKIIGSIGHMLISLEQRVSSCGIYVHAYFHIAKLL
ncbi:hypothetical protein ACJX0J_029515 [Zea mays]